VSSLFQIVQKHKQTRELVPVTCFSLPSLALACLSQLRVQVYTARDAEASDYVLWRAGSLVCLDENQPNARAWSSKSHPAQIFCFIVQWLGTSRKSIDSLSRVSDMIRQGTFGYCRQTVYLVLLGDGRNTWLTTLISTLQRISPCFNSTNKSGLPPPPVFLVSRSTCGFLSCFIAALSTGVQVPSPLPSELYLQCHLFLEYSLQKTSWPLFSALLLRVPWRFLSLAPGSTFVLFAKLSTQVAVYIGNFSTSSSTLILWK
jgi:hypothetical protein